MYIAKSKIHIQTKRIGRKRYSSKNGYTGYLYLDVTEDHKINLNLRIKDKRNSIRVNIGKYAVYDMLMYHLSFRPIERPKGAIVYLNERARALKSETDFGKLTPDQIKKEYEESIEGLKSVIKVGAEPGRIRMAERQLEKLVESNWKIKLLHDIWLAKNIKKVKINSRKNPAV